VKYAGRPLAVWEHASLLRELTCHIRSHSLTCHPADVTFPPLRQPITAGTRFRDPGRMRGWVYLVSLVTYRGGVPTHSSTNQAQSTYSNYVHGDQQSYHYVKPLTARYTSFYLFKAPFTIFSRDWLWRVSLKLSVCRLGCTSFGWH